MITIYTIKGFLRGLERWRFRIEIGEWDAVVSLLIVVQLVSLIVIEATR